MWGWGEESGGRSDPPFFFYVLHPTFSTPAPNFTRGGSGGFFVHSPPDFYVRFIRRMLSCNWLGPPRSHYCARTAFCCNAPRSLRSDAEHVASHAVRRYVYAFSVMVVASGASSCFGGTWESSLEEGNCVEPLLHDAAYGRGYGRKADKRARQPLSFDAMRARRPGQLPKPAFEAVQGGNRVISENVDPGNRYSATLRLVKESKKARKKRTKMKKKGAASGPAAIFKANYHPFWRCTVQRLADSASVEEDVTDRIAHVAPGYMALPLPGPGPDADRVTWWDVHVSCAYEPPVWKKALFWGGLVYAGAAGLVLLFLQRGALTH